MFPPLAVSVFFGDYTSTKSVEPTGQFLLSIPVPNPSKADGEHSHLHHSKYAQLHLTLGIFISQSLIQVPSPFIMFGGQS
jgi:hypothetical protein